MGLSFYNLYPVQDGQMSFSTDNSGPDASELQKCQEHFVSNSNVRGDEGEKVTHRTDYTPLLIDRKPFF